MAVPEDIPADVREVVTQLLAESGRAVADEPETARRSVDTVETVVTNKLPEGELRAEMRHGCRRVTALLDPADGGVRTDAAAEYLAAMERRFAGAGP